MIAQARDKLLAKLKKAGVSAIAQDRLDLDQNGVYLVFNGALIERNRPIEYRFSLWIVSNNFEQKGGAYETIDAVLAAFIAEEREFGRAEWSVGEAALERIEGSLSEYRIAITVLGG
ncbi:MAG: hypothetical protein LBO72_08105 [Helicobacteraceae bacterium]|jgi:hypothetical protein|nr:hypothetical protein [Helicobacteraceae bacterium]